MAALQLLFTAHPEDARAQVCEQLVIHRAMAANKQVRPYPHPAFPESLLPHTVQKKLQQGNKPHYPQEYLNSLKPYDSPPEQVGLVYVWPPDKL